MSPEVLDILRQGVHGMLGAAELLSLLSHFLLLSVLSVGGVITMAPDMHRFLVDEQGWMGDLHFADAITIAQAAPGPNVLFVTLMGWAAAGPAGALATTVGVMLPSSLIAFAAGRRLRAAPDAPLGLAFRRGLAPIAVGLTLAAGWLLARSADLNWKLGLLTGASVSLVLTTRINPMWMIAAGAAMGVAGWLE